MSSVNITVFLQALGGKFLGPNAYQNTAIRIYLLLEGQTYAFTYDAATSGMDDGQIGQQFSNVAPYALPILTLQTNGGYQTNYLTADSNTVKGTLTVEVPNVSSINALIKAYIPSPTGLTLAVEQPIVLAPPQTEYMYLIPVAGLLLEPNPATLPEGVVSVLVKMMCGCQVTVGKSNSYWSPGDFDVRANVNFGNNGSDTFPLVFDSSSNDSAFTALIPGAAAALSICFTAQQSSTGNFGYLAVNS
ncbi:hypothetical protein [Paraflavitalea speifideaquila]|uniref:hypothetical protein n=1 Tax=Paraflavitalea speifideaquila TaxID=3076558 RepID=UPI0028EF68CB|nr:hypothetical protein [Paraflavitalea speifideiaquila]